MLNNQHNKTKKQPSHILYNAEGKEGDKKRYWRPVGAAWPLKDNKGFSLRLDYIPVNGDGTLVLHVNEPKSEPSSSESSAF